MTNGDPGPIAIAITTPRCDLEWDGADDHPHRCILATDHHSQHVCNCGTVTDR